MPNLQPCPVFGSAAVGMGAHAGAGFEHETPNNRSATGMAIRFRSKETRI